MENSIYLGLSHQVAMQNNMQIIANNIANVNTPGYRGQNLLFSEYISDPRGQDDPLSFVENQGQYENTSPGPTRQTGNPLDIALNGPGFIGVNGPGGLETYTRAGNFILRPDGGLITPAGYAVASNGGAEIIIPPDATNITIDELGFISSDDGIIDQIRIVEFGNTQALEPIGDNLYRGGNGRQALNTQVRQGMLEGSNVNAVLEMVHMIDTMRSFQATQNMLQSENERMRTAIRKLSEQN